MELTARIGSQKKRDMTRYQYSLEWHDPDRDRTIEHHRNFAGFSFFFTQNSAGDEE